LIIIKLPFFFTIETGNINQKDDPLEVKNQKEKIMKELEI